jgi:hypothetical protein
VKSKLALLLIVVAGTASLAVSAPGQDLRPPQPPPAPATLPPGAAAYTLTAPEPLLAPAGNYSLDTVYRISRDQTHEEASLAQKATSLAKQLGTVKSDDDRDKLKTELSTVLEKQFDLRQKRHQKEIDSLETQVKKLKNLVDKRQENRREIIAKRLEQIQREADGLGW